MNFVNPVNSVHAALEIDEQAALGIGMKEKAEEFSKKGAEVYAKA